MMNSGIYLIRNSVSGLCYVGQSQDILARWRTHRYVLSAKGESRRANKHLRSSVHKHGLDAFHLIVLERCSVAVLTEREQWWLNFFRRVRKAPIANTDGPVDNPWRGRKHSKETLATLSKKSREMIRTPEHRAAISAALTGLVRPPEFGRKVSASKTGKKIPSLMGNLNPSRRPSHLKMMREDNPAKRPEVREKMSIANSKPVIELSSGKRWRSASVCADEIGVTVQALSRHLTGKSQTCAKRTFSYC